MKVKFKKELELEINMEELLKKCISQLNRVKKLLKYHNCPFYYENLESLVQDSLSYIYNTIFENYDNCNEKINIIAKNLLMYCVENNYIEEYKRLINLH